MKALKILSLAAAVFAALGCPGVKLETTSNSNANQTVSVNANGNADANQSASANSEEATAQKTAPDALVKDLYKQHDADNSPFFQTKSRAKVDKYFTKNLADLIWKDAKGAADAINADPLYNSHDPEVKNFSVGAPKVEKDAATVVASFVNYGAKEAVTYKLMRENSDWKIADIEYKDGNTLVKMFKGNFYKVDEKEQSDAPTDAEVGNFEGTYRVGETTCTVKPIKMAFEVRWKKGSGSMIFFGEEGNRFVSQDKGKGQDVFVFDDDSLDTGKFVRADGKEMTVKRIK